MGSYLEADIAILKDVYLHVALFSPSGPPGVLDDPVQLRCIAHQKHGMINFCIGWALDDSIGIVFPTIPSTAGGANGHRCFPDSPSQVATSVDDLNPADFVCS